MFSNIQVGYKSRQSVVSIIELTHDNFLKVTAGKTSSHFMHNCLNNIIKSYSVEKKLAF